MVGNAYPHTPASSGCRKACLADLTKLVCMVSHANHSGQAVSQKELLEGLRVSRAPLAIFKDSTIATKLGGTRIGGAQSMGVWCHGVVLGAVLTCR